MSPETSSSETPVWDSEPLLNEFIENALLNHTFTLEYYQYGNRVFHRRLEAQSTLRGCDAVEEKWTLFMAIYRERAANIQQSPAQNIFEIIVDDRPEEIVVPPTQEKTGAAILRVIRNTEENIA